MSLPRSCITLPQQALDREWLVANELGGFASGTVSQANTRRYHGWLVASLRPPVDRVVMLAKADATVVIEGRRYSIGCNEFADGTVSPQGFQYLASFDVVQGVPTWMYQLEDVVLEQRIWMAAGRNTTYAAFTLRGSRSGVTLELNPLCTYRDYHSHGHGGGSMDVSAEPRGCRIAAFPGARSYVLELDSGEFVRNPDWYWRFRHRAEADRGLDEVEDLLSPGVFRCALLPGQTATLVASAESTQQEESGKALRRRIDRTHAVLKNVPQDAPDWVRRLTLAAEQFIVDRAISGVDGAAALTGKTVIAGYPWFSDWGRDTMIALPGLTMATGRLDAAAAILRTFARHTDRGMLPNRFPDGGEAPEYNTVDAALWFFHAVSKYLDASGDTALLRDIYPVLKDIVDWHERGTRFSIAVDPKDGLLRSGEPGVQLTWMDAKIGDWVVTPRTGKAVEINALWHFALLRMAGWASEMRDQTAGAHYSAAAQRVVRGFSDAFWFEAGGYLYDVIDGPDLPQDAHGRSVDSSLRPNQIFAISVGEGLLDPARARAVVDVCARELLTPVGLRSLARQERGYAGRYIGGPTQRDAIYHQGTVWGWLLGPFALAHYRVHRDARTALSLLDGMAAHLGDACLDNVSEIFDGDAPHWPRGCFAQAWSVSETLRAWHYLREQT